jgi:hypothetical protein
MVRTNINKNLIKSMGKYPVVNGADLEEIEEVVSKEALRKKGRRKINNKKSKKKDCGCDK